MPRTSDDQRADREQDDEDEEDGAAWLHPRPARRPKPTGIRPARRSATQRCRIGAGRAQIGEARRAVALGEALAVRRRRAAVMVVARRRQAEQRLEQAVDVRRLEQVGAAHDVGDALRGIVDGDREMIGGRRILAREHDVALQLGHRRRRSPASSSCQRSGPAQRDRLGHVEPPAMRLAPPSARPRRPADRCAAGARIDRPSCAVRRGRAGGDLGAGAEAGIDQPFAASAARAPRRRAPAAPTGGSPSPSQASPSQRRSSSIPSTNVLARSAPDRYPRSAAGSGRPRPRARSCARERREGVAEMQPPGRARREAGDDRSRRRRKSSRRPLTASRAPMLSCATSRCSGIRRATKTTQRPPGTAS